MREKKKALASVSSRPKIHSQEFVLGIDGGGTKTRAVIMDENNRMLGEGLSGPSNPLRVGVAQAASEIRHAVDRACHSASVHRSQLVAAEVGLAGVRRGDLRQRMREALTGLGIHQLEVVTDADIALFGATGGEQGLVVIAGTGSICCGMNRRGRKSCAGGWGPVAGDEGSGSWIARRALQAVARASDGRGLATELSEAACDYFKARTDDDLAIAIYAPHMTNDRIAGFARFVIDAAEDGDKIARAIVCEAGRELGLAACAVIRKLQMERERFQVAYVGGVFTAGETILGHMRRQIKTLAPRVFTAPPKLSPAEAAARMAATHLPRLALAG